MGSDGVGSRFCRTLRSQHANVKSKATPATHLRQQRLKQSWEKPFGWTIRGFGGLNGRAGRRGGGPPEGMRPGLDRRPPLEGSSVNEALGPPSSEVSVWKKTAEFLKSTEEMKK